MGIVFGFIVGTLVGSVCGFRIYKWDEEDRKRLERARRAGL